tara:strand:+ start:1938 stop:2225 length:288 start_codon:yes stop_codon:yes gene_type:complete
MIELIEKLEIAEYTNNHGFPDDYYVKEYTAENGVTQYAIITIHRNYDSDGYVFQIAHAGSDWNEPVDFYCSPNHDISSVTDTIWEAEQIIKKHEK